MNSFVPWLMWFIGGLLCVLEMMFRNAPSVITQDLMSHYKISSTQLGLLVSSYYYPYVLLQVPGGIILDLWGTKRMALFITCVSTIAFSLFSSGVNLWTAYLGRILLGFAASCAFITALKISTQWFSPDRFAAMSGLTNMMLTIGGIAAGYPLAYLVESLGWQKASFVLSGVGVIWAVIVFFVVKDPVDTKYDTLNLNAFLQTIKRVANDRKLWRIGIVSACLYLPFSAFAELWAIPYLATTYSLPTTKAASISVLLYFGSALGSLFLAPIAKVAGSYLAGLRITAFSVMILFTFMSLFFPVSYVWIVVLFFMLGVIIAGQMLAFSWAHEGAADNEQGVRLGFVNAITMIAPIVIQPLLGYILDIFWAGEVSPNGVKIYTAHAYNCAILLFPVFCAVALFLLRKSED